MIEYVSSLILKADVVCIVYDVTNPDTIDKVGEKQFEVECHEQPLLPPVMLRLHKTSPLP